MCTIFLSGCSLQGNESTNSKSTLSSNELSSNDMSSNYINELSSVESTHIKQDENRLFEYMVYPEITNWKQYTNDKHIYYYGELVEGETPETFKFKVISDEEIEEELKLGTKNMIPNNGNLDWPRPKTL